MAGSGITINLGLVKFDLSAEDVDSIRRRFRVEDVYGGPCLRIERSSGLVLDATVDKTPRTRPLLWSATGAPWQQWRIKDVGGSSVRIVSEYSGMALTTDKPGGDGSWVWLDPDNKLDERQLWRLSPYR